MTRKPRILAGLNRAAGYVATSGQDAQKQMQGKPTGPSRPKVQSLQGSWSIKAVETPGTGYWIGLEHPQSSVKWRRDHDIAPICS
jgi:hypothetical protein